MNQVSLNKDEDQNSLKFHPKEGVGDMKVQIGQSSNELSHTEKIHQATSVQDIEIGQVSINDTKEEVSNPLQE